MQTLTIPSSHRWVVLPVLLLAGAACSQKSESPPGNAPPANAPPANAPPANAPPANAPPASAAQSANPDSLITLRGTVVSASATELVLKTDSNSMTVKLVEPFHLFARGPSDLSQVKESRFIGVTTVKQPDGSERATEIHVFPEELRGLGEGSRMMTPDTSSAASSANRMTNGNVTASRMTNGTATPSRMSNGNVSQTNGSVLIVEYAGGSQTVTVPPNTPVTEFKAASSTLSAGDKVVVMAKRGRGGVLSSNTGLLTTK